MTKRRPEKAPVILTIGHSTHTLEDFIRLLQAHAVSLVVDIRTVPRDKFRVGVYLVVDHQVGDIARADLAKHLARLM